LTTPCCSTGNLGSVLRASSKSHLLRTHAPLIVTLLAYSCAARSHISGVLMCRSYSRFRRTHVPLVVSRYPSRLVWSRRSLLTHLAWACCSRGIRHAWRGLVAVFSHTLHGLVVLAVSVMSGVVSSRSSHMPCMGSLFLSEVVVAAPVHG